MQPNSVISEEDFSRGGNGWSINRPEASTDGDVYIGRFTTDIVEKTYDLPADVSGGITISFDFLEIDSWDGESFLVYINGQEIEIGSFNWQTDEAAATFETDNGIIVERSAATEIEGYGDQNNFWSFNDSAHAVTIFVPDPGPTLTLGFSSTLDQDVLNESFGIDNILISTVADANTGTPAQPDTGTPAEPDTETPSETTTVISEEDFSRGGNGWSINRPEASTDGDVYIGRFTTDIVEKTYDLPADVSGGITISFDFLEIDSWDGESFLVYINGQEIEIGSFNWQTDEAAATFETDNGIIVERSAATEIEGYGDQNNFWSFNDSAHAVTIFVPDPGPTLTLGFSSTLDQDVLNESFGIDNILISTVVDPNGTTDPEPEAPPLPTATFEYTTPEEALQAMYPDMPSVSLQEVVDSITQSREWTGGEITFSFPTEESDDYIGNGREGTLHGFGLAQQAVSRDVMAHFDEIIGFDVVDLGDSVEADIRFYNSTLQLGVFGGGLPGDGIAGDMWAYGPQIGDPNHDTRWSGAHPGDGTVGIMIHEVGHTMGLLHTDFLPLEEGDDVSFPNLSAYLQGSDAYSVMSYWSYDFVGLQSDSPSPGTLMLADIAALHQIYGANMETRTEDTTYGFNATTDQEVYDYDAMLANHGNTAAFTIWDAGGNDTLDMSGFSEGSFISLIDGTFSSTGGFDMNVAIAQGATIENAIGGSGDDQLIGNEVNNVMVGNDGNDLIIGAGGSDVLRGGSGDDHLSGGDGADLMVGGAGDDILSGGAGADVFSFVGGSGVDVITDWDASEDEMVFTDTGISSYDEIQFVSASAGDVVGGYTLTQDAVYFAHGAGPDPDLVILLETTMAGLSNPEDFSFG
ncbi:M10 family metallopeptidase C-terminal domain-containing protein [uncultured Tateyamaria sp.]|uniref:M10 family metallopeptidase C-terminal domain-containing protein n=1 Tax=Tateyamaria sp. 1078 TaxID=3417464 RepID=UPI00260991C0|nr:M10 family metallopeptidase C-terminal domain-containing protein [uncultured Tateyamaria sp.]